MPSLSRVLGLGHALLIRLILRVWSLVKMTIQMTIPPPPLFFSKVNLLGFLFVVVVAAPLPKGQLPAEHWFNHHVVGQQGWEAVQLGCSHTAPTGLGCCPGTTRSMGSPAAEVQLEHVLHCTSHINGGLADPHSLPLCRCFWHP